MAELGFVSRLYLDIIDELGSNPKKARVLTSRQLEIESDLPSDDGIRCNTKGVGGLQELLPFFSFEKQVVKISQKCLDLLKVILKTNLST